MQASILITQLPLCYKCSSHSSLLCTYFSCNISWVRAPAPIGCTHCCHLTHWTKPLVTLVDQSCAGIVYNTSISRRSWNSTICCTRMDVYSSQDHAHQLKEIMLVSMHGSAYPVSSPRNALPIDYLPLHIKVAGSGVHLPSSPHTEVLLPSGRSPD